MQLHQPTPRRSLARTMIAVCTGLLLTACASGGSSLNNEGGLVTIRQMMSLAGAHFLETDALDHEVLTVDTVLADPAKTWMGVVHAYQALRIPVTRYDENMLWIGGSSQPLGSIGGSKPSAWLDCGHGMAEQYADAYQVTFSIATRVVLLDTKRSTVETLVVASARPRDVSTAPFKCSTRGTLEPRIAEIARTQAGAAPAPGD